MQGSFVVNIETADEHTEIAIRDCRQGVLERWTLDESNGILYYIAYDQEGMPFNEMFCPYPTNFDPI